MTLNQFRSQNSILLPNRSQDQLMLTQRYLDCFWIALESMAAKQLQLGNESTICIAQRMISRDAGQGAADSESTTQRRVQAKSRMAAT